MVKYIEVIDKLPDELRYPLIKAFELLKEEIAETVKRTDFEELKGVVGELAEAQKRTEQKVEELAEAQKRTEQKVEELAEAQKRTEQKVGELAEAQKRTEQKVEELAEAQKRTEDAIKKLTENQRKMREEIGGLSHAIGYRLEDEAFLALPQLLKEDLDITIRERLRRSFIEIAPERYLEINIYGKAIKDGKTYIIVGEAKTQLKKKDIDDFIRKADELRKYIPEEQLRLMVTYHTSPSIERYLKDNGILLYYSYDLLRVQYPLKSLS